MAEIGDERAVPIAMRGSDAEGGAALEGLFASAAGEEGAVIAPPHPLFGGSMDSPVVSELAFACGRAGIATLRFNWRGVGASAGHPSGNWGDAEDDVEAALAHLADTVPGALVGCGYSFGAIAVGRLASRHPRVRRLVLVAPPADLLEEGLLDTAGADVLLLAGEHDPLAPPRRLRALAEGRGGVRVVEIEDADHFFGAGLADLGGAAARWLRGE